MAMIRREQCPRCAEEGGDSAGNNLAVYSDGSAWCYAGHKMVYKKGGTMKKSEYSEKSSMTPEDCMLYPVGTHPDRKISDIVATLYNVRNSFTEETRECEKVYYPYYDDAGNLTGVKIRKVATKTFVTSGEIKGLFGKNTIKPGSTVCKYALLLTEGEEDALALKQMLLESSLGGLVVCSLPHGASLDKTTREDIEFFKRFREVAICLDNDKPGIQAAKEVASWLVGFVDKVKIVQLPRKDASECLVNGLVSETIDAIKKAAAFVPEGIVKGSDVTIADIRASAVVGYPFPYKGLNDKLKGLRKGELITLCAAPGVGKSTLSRELAYHLAVNLGLSVCHIALETKISHVHGTYVAMWNGVSPAEFKKDTSILTDTQIQEGLDNVVSKMYFYAHFGSVDTRTFKERLLYYARMGVDFIVLDHLSMVISGLGLPDERREIDKVMTELASMVVETGVGIISVVHLKRRETGNKDAGLAEGGKVSLTDLRGSSALEGLSWAVIAIERDTQADDGSEDFSTIRVLKNREWGYTGKAGRLMYRHDTGRLIEAPTEEPEPKPEDDTLEKLIADIPSLLEM